MGTGCEIAIGMSVRHKLTQEDMLILEIGPRTKPVMLPTDKGLKAIQEEYLKEGQLRVRLKDLKIIDIWDYELVGIEPRHDGKILLMEKN